MLIHQPGQVPALDVVPRSGVRAWHGTTAPLDSVVAGLRAGTVVEGKRAALRRQRARDPGGAAFGRHLPYTQSS
ncbi:MAG TPA: hypothetical protein VFS20_06545, partial [Longimicrobium sp.]|nr:hypothetical protein [Longimicrobium sp.]